MIDPPLTIVAVIHSLAGGGAERVIAKLSSRFAIAGHHVTLVTLDDGSVELHDVDASVDRVCLDVMRQSHGHLQRLVNTLSRLRAIRNCIRRLQPDVVLSFCDQTNIAVLAATRGLGIPIVISERSDPSQQQLGRVWESARRRFYPQAVHTIALTQSSANYLRPMCPRGVTVIPSAVDTPSMVRSPQAVDAKRVIAIGRLAAEKGFDRLVESFDNATAIHSDWTLVILGEGSERQRIQSLIDSRGLADRVKLLGWVRPVADELARSTFYVLPSRYEGFPSALLEAMSLGVPSLATDCESGPREIIESGINGLLVQNSTEGLSSGIQWMINHPQSREQLGAAGRSVTQRFDWPSMVSAYECVLRDSARRSSAGPANVRAD